MVRGIWHVYDRLWKARNGTLHREDGLDVGELKRQVWQLYANPHRFVGQSDMGLFH